MFEFFAFMACVGFSFITALLNLLFVALPLSDPTELFITPDLLIGGKKLELFEFLADETPTASLSGPP